MLLDLRVCHVNSFPTDVLFFSSGSDHFNIREINSQFFATVFIPSAPSCLCFPALPPFSFKESDVLTKYPFIDGKPLHPFPSMFLPGGSHEDVLQVYHSSFFFFSGGLNSSLQCWSHSFPCFKCFSHAGVSLNHSPLAFHVFRSVEDISGDSCFHS